MNQRNLILLNLWRLVGFVFVILMWTGQVPAVWALPAGIGDIPVGATVPWIANQLETPHGRQRAIVFNFFGMADLVVAIALGMMTSPGPAHFVDTTPTSKFITHFPLALVPAFLVPLAFMLHVISLWQLFGAPGHQQLGSLHRRAHRSNEAEPSKLRPPTMQAGAQRDY
jgi:hypothetical protein